MSLLTMNYSLPVFSQIDKVNEPVIAIIRPAEEKKPEPKTYTVQPGDTLESIATANATTALRLFNKNTAIANPDIIQPGEALTIPLADEVLTERVIIQESGQSSTTLASSPSGGFSSSGNSYSYGYCTWAVKNWRSDISNGWGDATTWYARAQADGWATSAIPRVGSIAWARGYGHVAYVISVGAGTVTVREANYKGWNIISTRVAPVTEFLYIL